MNKHKIQMKRKSLKTSRFEQLNNNSVDIHNTNRTSNSRLSLESFSENCVDATSIKRIKPPMHSNGEAPTHTFNHKNNQPTHNQVEQKGEQEVHLSDLPWGQRWLSFVDNVSIVGLKYAVDPQASNIHRVVWGVLVLAGIALMVYQITDRCIYYVSYPKTTNTEYLNEAKVRFPTVTICNENLVAASRAQDHGFSDLIASIYPPYPDPTFTPNFTAFEPLFETLREEDYDWRNAWYYWSHVYTRDDWIFSCTFNGANCGDDDITEVVNTMGWCIQFNGAGSNHKSMVPGAYNGLSLILDTQQSEYLYGNSRGAGFRILLHSPHEYPYVDFKGFRVGPGQSTSVSVLLNNITLLPTPYGDCEDKDVYDYNTCLGVCSSEYVAKQCSCKLWFSDISGYRSCDPQEQYECADPAYFYFVQNFVTGGFEKSCDCPRDCKTMNYDATISSNTISKFAMTTIAETFFVNKTCEDESDSSNCTYTPDLNTTVTELYNDLVDLQIYFESLTVEDVVEVPRYTILSLFCDVGGAMGLILGSTMLTLAELGEFIAFLIYDVIFFKISQLYFRIKRQKIQPVHLM